jgi:hypothetical protein
MFYKTCASCRAKAKLRVAQKRAQAEMHGNYQPVVLVTLPLTLDNTGRRYCVAASHQVSVLDCTSRDGTLQTSCHACLARRREECHAALDAAAAPSTLQHPELRAEENWLDGDVDGVELGDFDEFDNVFGDGTDLMDVDLPGDSALSPRETALLQNLDKKMDDIQFTTCDDCLEEGFDLALIDRRCSRCRRDTGDPVRKWSAANNVHPGRSFIRLVTLSVCSFPNSTRHTSWSERVD